MQKNKMTLECLSMFESVMLGLTQYVDRGSRDDMAITPHVHLSRQLIFS